MILTSLSFTEYTLDQLHTDILRRFINLSKLYSALIIFFAYGFGFILKKEKFTIETIKIIRKKILYKCKSIGPIFILIVLFISYVCSFGILSASTTCVILAPILLPLLFEVGLSKNIASALIVIGTIGALINPASTNAQQFHDNCPDFNITLYHIFPSLLALVVIGLSFFYINKKEIVRSTKFFSKFKKIDEKKINTTKSLITFLPFFLLLLAGIFLTIRYNINKIGPSKDYFFLDTQFLSIIIMIICTCVSLQFLKVNKKHKSYRLYINIGLKNYLLEGWSGIKKNYILIIAAQFFTVGFMACMGNSVIQHFIKDSKLVNVPTIISVTLLLTYLIGSGDPIIIMIMGLFNSTHSHKIGSSTWFAGEIGRALSPLSVANQTIADKAKADLKSIISLLWLPVLLGLLFSEIFIYFQDFLYIIF